jgi:hypothetical protein
VVGGPQHGKSSRVTRLARTLVAALIAVTLHAAKHRCGFGGNSFEMPGTPGHCPSSGFQALARAILQLRLKIGSLQKGSSTTSFRQCVRAAAAVEMLVGQIEADPPAFLGALAQVATFGMCLAGLDPRAMSGWCMRASLHSFLLRT